MSGPTELTRTGLFSAMPPLCIGSEYETGDKLPERYQGKQFGVPFPKGGHEKTISKDFKRLSEGDTYVDPGAAERRKDVESRKKFASPKPFFPSNPAKTSSHKGSWQGCFGKSPEFMRDDEREDAKPPREHLRNFTAAVPKKGSYGTPGTTMGKPLDYFPEPYLPARAMEKTEQKAAREKIQKPFISTARPGLIAKKDYLSYEPGAFAPKEKKSKEVSEDVASRPRFKPSNPPKKGRAYAGIGKFPPSMDDPYGLKGEPPHKFPIVFKPNGHAKSFPHRDNNPFMGEAKPSPGPVVVDVPRP
ncbi:DUF4586 domain-containing protein [Pycnococcus provasolii]